MAKQGSINYIDVELPPEEFTSIGFPALYILKGNNEIIKLILFDQFGNRLDSNLSFNGIATEEFVNQAISDAISNLKDNTLEFPTFADFPQPGEIGNVYIDLSEDKIYIWDSSTNSYISQSWNQTIINSIQTQIISLQNSKLNKPTSTGNTTNFPYVVGEDGNGNSARLPAGDLGKNFFNADLNNTTARNHTMNAGVTINTLGNPYSITGLPNKNTDITNFRKVRVQNTSGLDAVVDSKNLLTDGVTSMSDAEKDAWRIAQRKSNENYSTGQPQPFAVFPPIVGNTNEIQEIVVVGSNLFLNNSSPSTALVCLVSETGTEYPLNVEVNQTNPSVLSFGYNFSTLPLGNYWIKVVHNGLINLNKVYLQVTNIITPQPLPNLTWNGYRQVPNTYFTDGNNTPDFVMFTPTSFNFTRKYNPIKNNDTAINEGNVYINSSAFTLPNDFYLEFAGTCPWQSINNWGGRHPTISMGLSAYNANFDISNTYIAGFGLVDGNQNSKLFSDTSVNLNMGDVTNFILYVIKRGSKITLGIKSKSGVLYSTYTAPAGNQFMIKFNHYSTSNPSQNTLISFALTKILSL